MTVFSYPLRVEIESGVFICARDEGLYRIDTRPGAVCPCETIFPGKAAYLAYIALLSPQLLGPQCTTTPARRAAWVYATRYARRFMLRYVAPFMEAHSLARAPAPASARVKPRTRRRAMAAA